MEWSFCPSRLSNPSVGKSSARSFWTFAARCAKRAWPRSLEVSTDTVPEHIETDVFCSCDWGLNWFQNKKAGTQVNHFFKTNFNGSWLPKDMTLASKRWVRYNAGRFCQEFKGTAKEILGTCFAVGCTVDGQKPGALQQAMELFVCLKMCPVSMFFNCFKVYSRCNCHIDEHGWKL